MSSNRPSHLLYELVPVRLFLVVMLVLLHAFAIFSSNSWTPISGYPRVFVYELLHQFTIAFLLESFVFMSGYIFGYQVRMKGSGILTFKNVVVKKIRRLIIPSIIFSTVYFVLYGDYNQAIVTVLYKILCGVAHMWFLTMLFWCFVITFMFENFKITVSNAFLFCVLLMFFVPLELPLGINPVKNYLLFFYLGYIIQKKNVSDFLFSQKTLLYSSFLFIIFFLFKINMAELAVFDRFMFLNKFINHSLEIGLKALCALFGIFLLFNLSKKYILSIDISSPLFGNMLKIGECCFGVYIIHHFILPYLYYHSSIPFFVNPYLMPWISFVVTLIISLGVSILIRKTKIGKSLL